MGGRPGACKARPVVFPPAMRKRERAMRTKDREFLIEQSRKRLDSMFVRFEQIREAYPWLAPSMTYAEVRRTVSRLREGSFHSPEPDIPSDELADVLEGAIEKDALVRSMLKEWDELTALRRSKGRTKPRVVSPRKANGGARRS